MNETPSRRAPATKAIMVAILIGFVFEIVTGAWNDPDLLAWYGSIVPELIKDGQYWRLLTAMFLHGNGTIPITIVHLTMNLFVLWQLGTLYELMFGTRRFLLIYFVAGLCASITSAAVIHGSSAGASGAIFGIIGALITSIRRSPRYRSHPVARSIVQQMVFWSLANIAIGLQFPQIDLAAHIGGFLTGLLLGALLPHHEPPPSPAQVVIDVRPYEGPAGDPEARRDDR